MKSADQTIYRRTIDPCPQQVAVIRFLLLTG